MRENVVVLTCSTRTRPSIGGGSENAGCGAWSSVGHVRGVERSTGGSTGERRRRTLRFDSARTRVRRLTLETRGVCTARPTATAPNGVGRRTAPKIVRVSTRTETFREITVETWSVVTSSTKRASTSETAVFVRLRSKRGVGSRTTRTGRQNTDVDRGIRSKLGFAIRSRDIESNGRYRRFSGSYARNVGLADIHG